MKNKIHAIYFACGKHFEYLFISLKSLAGMQSRYLGKTYVYIDEQDFLTTEQANKIVELGLNHSLRKCKKVTGHGRETVLNEVEVFKKVSDENNPDDFLAKVDSDIIFLSDRIFAKVLNSDNLMLGHQVNFWTPFVYTQGGCYFIKNSVVAEIGNVDQTIFSEVLGSINSSDLATTNNWVVTNFPEDAVIYSLVRKLTDKIRFENFIGSPNFIGFQKHADLIHFEGNMLEKDKMLAFANHRLLFSIKSFLLCFWKLSVRKLLQAKR